MPNDHYDQREDLHAAGGFSSITNKEGKPNLGAISTNFTLTAATFINRNQVVGMRWVNRPHTASGNNETVKVLQQGYHATKGTKSWIEWEDVPTVSE